MSVSDQKPADYPLLSSELVITAKTLAEVVKIVRAAYAQRQQTRAARCGLNVTLTPLMKKQTFA